MVEVKYKEIERHSHFFAMLDTSLRTIMGTAFCAHGGRDQLTQRLPSESWTTHSHANRLCAKHVENNDIMLCARCLRTPMLPDKKYYSLKEKDQNWNQSLISIRCSSGNEGWSHVDSQSMIPIPGSQLSDRTSS